MFKYFTFICLFVFSLSTFAKDTTTKTERFLMSQERIGIKHHKKGRYKKAYETLYETATWGLKDSQYFMALMYLKGQHIKQDTIIGMGLLAVSNEADIKERNQLYNTIYKALSEDEKILVDKKATDYIERFGLKAKGYVCSDSQDLGSRKNVVNCQSFRSKVSGSFVID